MPIGLLAHERRGDRGVPELSLGQISEQLSLGVDRVMAEGSLYDRELAALAIKQARGDLIEAIFLVRAFRATLPRFGATRAGRYRTHAGAAAGILDLQGHSGRADPRTDLRLHPSPASTRSLPKDSSRRAPATGEALSSATPRVTDILGRDGLIEPSLHAHPDAPSAISPASRWIFPADRDLRLQNLSRADEGFLLALGYSTQRGYGRNHPFAGEIRFGEVEVEFLAEGCRICRAAWLDRADRMPDVNQFKGSATEAPCFTRGYGLAFGQSERKTMSMALVDRALRARELGEEVNAPAQDEEFVLSHSDNVQATGFVEHLKLPHYVDFQSELGLLRKLRARNSPIWPRPSRCRRPRNERAVYNFAYLDEQTKRMIRRAILKAIAIPGYQVPFASREMPMPLWLGHRRRAGHRLDPRSR